MTTSHTLTVRSGALALACLAAFVMVRPDGAFARAVRAASRSRGSVPVAVDRVCATASEPKIHRPPCDASERALFSFLSIEDGWLIAFAERDGVTRLVLPSPHDVHGPYGAPLRALEVTGKGQPVPTEVLLDPRERAAFVFSRRTLDPVKAARQVGDDPLDAGRISRALNDAFVVVVDGD